MKFRNHAARLTMFIFGLLAFILGVLGLTKPKTLLKQMGFRAIDREERGEDDYTHIFVMTSSMASTNENKHMLAKCRRTFVFGRGLLVSLALERAHPARRRWLNRSWWASVKLVLKFKI